MEIFEGFVCHPTICVVGDKYQIIIPVKYEMLLSVRIGEKIYHNHCNGVRISNTRIQRVTVPISVLDKAKEYEIIVQKVIDRKPYFPQLHEKVVIKYKFYPINFSEGIRLYQVADSHGCINEAIAAAQHFGRIDLLIMNGDVADSSNDFEQISTIYRIASAITSGSKPCVISRGNHDMRGYSADLLNNYLPNEYGRSYYTFKAGCIWGLVLDCGEDKCDDHPEYGGTICCNDFRHEQTEFLKEVVKRKSSEYDSSDVQYRIVVSHIPFTYRNKPPFDISQDVYSEWTRLLREEIKPQLIMCGHQHGIYISRKDGEMDSYGQPCTVLIGSDIKYDQQSQKRVYTGMGIELNIHKAYINFTTSEEQDNEHIIEF